MTILTKLYEHASVNYDEKCVQLLVEHEYNLTKINLEAEERLKRLQLDHEYKMAELANNTEIYIAEIKYSCNNSSRKRPSRRKYSNNYDTDEDLSVTTTNDSNEGFSQEDIDFNELSGFGLMPRANIGKIGKTTLTQAVRSKSAEIEPLWKCVLRNKSQSKDCNPARIRTLIGTFLYGSIASSRLDFWPKAPDSSMILTIKEEVLHRLNGYDTELIVPVFEFLKQYFKENYASTELEDINTSLFSDFIDDAYIKQEALDVYEEDYNILNSPFAKVFRPHIEHLDKALVDKLLIHYLETDPKAGMDKLVDIVVHHTEKYPNPLYEKEESADNWSFFFRKNHDRIRRDLENKIFDLHDENYDLHRKWLGEREKFLEDFAK